MIIVLASDNNFVQHCCVAMISILKNNKDVTFFVLTEGLFSSNKAIMQDLVKQNCGKINILEVPSEVVNKFPMPKNAADHISIATYYRLFVELLLPKDIEKVIYMDCDIVVRSSIANLWSEDISDYALGAIYQHNEWAFSGNSFGRLGFPEKYGYFNAGVLLINLKYWRENNITKDFFDYIRANSQNIRSHDQDVLNAVLFDKTKPMSCNWNMLSIFFADNKTFAKYTFPYSLYENIAAYRKEPAVIHYVSRPKPWEFGCMHRFVKDYYYYLSFTPWKNWRPQWSCTNMYKYVILPILKKAKRYFKS